MAKPGGKQPANDAPPPAATEPTAPPPQLELAALAEAILARTIRRPRVADIRRLAEAVLAGARKPDKKKKKKAAKKAERKLSKIPGQKARK